MRVWPVAGPAEATSSRSVQESASSRSPTTQVCTLISALPPVSRPLPHSSVTNRSGGETGDRPTP